MPLEVEYRRQEEGRESGDIGSVGYDADWAFFFGVG